MIAPNQCIAQSQEVVFQEIFLIADLPHFPLVPCQMLPFLILYSSCIPDKKRMFMMMIVKENMA
jgi:hypothetical protein